MNDFDEQTENSPAKLKAIAESCLGDLEALKERTNNITGNLKDISDDGIDLDALEKQLDRILAKVDQVKRVIHRYDS